MIAYMENTKESIVKLLDLMSEFGKALTINKIDRLDDIKIQGVGSFKGHHWQRKSKPQSGRKYL